MARGYRARARRGIVFMDSIYPEWREHLDTDTLDLGSESACVWGQVFGSFDQGYKSISILCAQRFNAEEQAQGTEWWKWITDHGFAFFHKPDEEGHYYCYPRTSLLRKRHRELTQAWIDELGTDHALE